ncbi:MULTISPECIES: secretion protein HlyD [Aquitalea]|uniref:HlyD family secretion protein n=1 Tax=Aquitalea magnusonii TaxID=332411 RepID=A0A318JBP9_9NEIS|nr:MULTISPECIES: secretion protein HlyD [Aquitalea]PXX46212.1 HlyD family secretion protein [Aquitalea magnusonii]
MNKRVLFGFVLLLLAGAAYLWWQQQQAADELVLSGNVDIREVNLSFRVGGRLQQLQVDEGAQIKAGQVLGRLDDAPQRNAVADAEAALAALQARQSLMHQGYRAEDVAQARAALDARQAALTDARAAWQRQQELAGTGAAAVKALDAARSAHDQAQAQYQAAQQQYQALSKGYRPQEVAEVDANVKRAQAQLASARLQLADTVLTAPADGIILTRAVEPGSMLAAGSSVLTLSLRQPVWVRAYVAEPQLGQAQPGRKVWIYRDGRSQPYAAVVGFVSPTAEFTPKNVETADLRTAQVYRLRLIVSQPDAALRQGMPVTVKLARP